MGATNMTINEALGHINPSDDAHWTSDGLPRMEVIEQMVGTHSITRKEVTDSHPEFCREWLIDNIAKAKAHVESEAEAAKEESDNEPSTQSMSRGQERRETETQTPQVSPEEALKAQIQEVGQAIEDLAKEEATIGKQKDALIKLLSQLQHKTFEQHSAAADTKARMVFIKSQQEQRAGRHARGRKIMALIGKDSINPQSKIDQAMRRKTARGMKRPPARTPRQQ